MVLWISVPWTIFSQGWEFAEEMSEFILVQQADLEMF